MARHLCNPTMQSQMGLSSRPSAGVEGSLTLTLVSQCKKISGMDRRGQLLRCPRWIYPVMINLDVCLQGRPVAVSQVSLFGERYAAFSTHNNVVERAYAHHL